MKDLLDELFSVELVSAPVPQVLPAKVNGYRGTQQALWLIWSDLIFTDLREIAVVFFWFFLDCLMCLQ